MESGWPDYNYGGWKDTIKNPKAKEKVMRCLMKVMSKKSLEKGLALLYSLLVSGGVGAIGLTIKDIPPFIACLGA